MHLSALSLLLVTSFGYGASHIAHFDFRKLSLKIFRFLRSSPKIFRRNTMIYVRVFVHSSMTTVMCFGTFDVLHEGHKFFLQQAKQQGDSLIVVLARDKTVVQVKGRMPTQPEQQRLACLQQHHSVDLAVLGNPGDKLQIVLAHKPDVLCLGYDQMIFTARLQEKLAALGLRPKIIRLPAYA